MKTLASSARATIATAALLFATSMVAAQGSDAVNLHQTLAAQQQTLPGVTAQIDPCGPKKSAGPLGY